MQTHSLDAIRVSPYPYRNQENLRERLGLSDAQVSDFTRAGFLLIIERLEAIAHTAKWARDALTAERRAYMLIHGAVEPYSLAEVKSPIRHAGELELEIMAARRFHHEFN